MSIASFASGKSFWDPDARPNITEEDAQGHQGAGAARPASWRMQLGGGPGTQLQRLAYGKQGDQAHGHHRLDGQLRGDQLHRDRARHGSSTTTRSSTAARWSCSAPRRRDAVQGRRIPSARRSASGRQEFTVVGVHRQAPEPARRQPGRVRRHPASRPTTSCTSRRASRAPAALRSMIAVVPREALPRRPDHGRRGNHAGQTPPEARRGEQFRRAHV